LELIKTHGTIVTVEENTVLGGAGSGVNELVIAAGTKVKLLNLGLPDKHINHGNPAIMLADCGLDAKGIRASILKITPQPTLSALQTVSAS
ncbi:MAG: transketolase C-terminal domain-containing protein, partial [Arenicellales bacterium WSBS_2016_MAG_OTU3]